MADTKPRFAPGGSRPAPATTIAAPRTELFPGIDRPTIVLWLGILLIAASEWVDYGPLRLIIDVGAGKKETPVGPTLGLREAIIELALVAFLWLLAMASDTSGTFAVLLVVALWVIWLLRHVGTVQTAVLGKSAQGK